MTSMIALAFVHHMVTNSLMSPNVILGSFIAIKSLQFYFKEKGIINFSVVKVTHWLPSSHSTYIVADQEEISQRSKKLNEGKRWKFEEK